MRLLIVTNLFGYPWDPARGTFNQQQFDRLAQQLDLRVLAAVPWPEAVRRPLQYLSAARDGRRRWPYVDYFIYWYPPGFARFMHGWCFLASLLLQRPWTLWRGGWDVLMGSWGYPDAVATGVVARWLGRPYVMKVHGTDVNDYLRMPDRRRAILKAAVGSQGVLCPSDAIGDQLRQAGLPPDQVHVVRNGVDIRRFHPGSKVDARQALGMDPADPVILFVGNLKVSKGCLDLVDAFASLDRVGDRAVLLVAGSGQAQAEMLRRAEVHGVGHRVRFLGSIDHDQIPTCYAAADLLCLPSHAEGLPNVVLEAMACGLPVVATQVGGVAEVLPVFAGVLVPVGQPAALVAALGGALTRHWDRERISAWARRFDWETNVSTVRALIERAAQKATAV
ncbi:MAG: glycosyltransferase [Aquabacterium sp.]